jgi:hypothetical protein
MLLIQIKTQKFTNKKKVIFLPLNDAHLNSTKLTEIQRKTQTL